MKVIELIDELVKYDGEMEIMCYLEDEGEPIFPKCRHSRILSKNGVDVTKGEFRSDENSVASIKFTR